MNEIFRDVFIDFLWFEYNFPSLKKIVKKMIKR